jgi:cell division septum initiation protein DivIVA
MSMNPDHTNEPAADEEPLLELLDDIGDLSIPDEYDEAEARLSQMTAAETEDAFNRLLAMAGLTTDAGANSPAGEHVECPTGTAVSETAIVLSDPAFSARVRPSPTPSGSWTWRLARGVIATCRRLLSIGRIPQRTAHPVNTPEPLRLGEVQAFEDRGATTATGSCDGLPAVPLPQGEAWTVHSGTDIGFDKTTGVARLLNHQVPALDGSKTRAHEARKMIIGSRGIARAHEEVAQLRAEALRLEADLIHARKMARTSLENALIADIQAEQIEEVARTRANNYLDKAVDDARAGRLQATAEATRIEEQARTKADTYLASATAHARRLIQEATDDAHRIVAEAEDFAGVLVATVEKLTDPQTRVEAAHPDSRHTEFHAVAEQHQMLLTQGDPIWESPHSGRDTPSSAHHPSAGPVIPLLRAKNHEHWKPLPKIVSWRAGLASARNLAIADTPSGPESPCSADTVEVVLALRQSAGWSHWTITVPSGRLPSEQRRACLDPQGAKQPPIPFSDGGSGLLETCTSSASLAAGARRVDRAKLRPSFRSDWIHDVAAYVQSPTYDIGQNVRWLVALPVALVMAVAVVAPTLWATMH